MHGTLRWIVYAIRLVYLCTSMLLVRNIGCMWYMGARNTSQGIMFILLVMLVIPTLPWRTRSSKELPRRSTPIPRNYLSIPSSLASMLSWKIAAFCAPCWRVQHSVLETRSTLVRVFALEKYEWSRMDAHPKLILARTSMVSRNILFELVTLVWGEMCCWCSLEPQCASSRLPPTFRLDQVSTSAYFSGMAG
jgi:hypothetical protein